MSRRDERARWNHNIHHHPVVLEAVRPAYARALDVGCGAGDLVRSLHRAGLRVTGLDSDRAALQRARAEVPTAVDLVQGDLLSHPFVPAAFDLVASVAALHHVDARTGLERLKELTAPGGTVVVVGLARTASPVDLAHDAAGFFATRYHHWLRRRPYADVNAPTIWPPPDTYTGVRAAAEHVLPGAAYRRHVLFRYSLTWVRPSR